MAVGRFQVMALLQAARAFTLGLPLDSAYSWGLNRAIFFAAAKRGFKGHGTTEAHPARPGLPPPARPDTYYLGDEMAFRAEGPGEPLFTIGGKTQTRQDFQRQIEARFGGRYKEAWEEAIDYVGRFPREKLLSGSEFFSSVYRPKRDELAERWSEMGAAEEPAAGVKRVVKRGSRPSRRPPSAR